MLETPEISVVLVTWNSGKVLSHCLEKLSQQTVQNFEIVIIDNGSTDHAVEEAIRQYPSLSFQISLLPQNHGFTVANNMGVRLARASWVILLNADAFPEPDWLENLFNTTKRNPTYTFFATRQIQFNTPVLLDGAGDAYHISGLAWRNAYNLKADENGLEQKEVFSPCAAAALYSREEFLKVGGFDEDYFSYFEDVDLGFRLRLSGAKCLYVPNAIVHHVGSASTGKRSDFSVYYGYRNLIWTFFKNMPSPYLWLLLPLHVSTVLFFAFYLTLRGQGGVIWKAILDALRGLPKTLAKRRTIQKNIKILPGELMKVMSTGILEPYIEFMSRNRKNEK